MLKTPAENFLSKDSKGTFGITKKHDLVMSLDVAKHLPDSTADYFENTLVSPGDVVLFFAAVPVQSGTYHSNEQYAEYWLANTSLVWNSNEVSLSQTKCTAVRESR